MIIIIYETEVLSFLLPNSHSPTLINGQVFPLHNLIEQFNAQLTISPGVTKTCDLFFLSFDTNRH